MDYTDPFGNALLDHTMVLCGKQVRRPTAGPLFALGLFCYRAQL